MPAEAVFADVTSVSTLEERYYPDPIDPNARFEATILQRLVPGSVVLDAGAGRGVRYPYDYRGIVDRVVGVDVDPIVRSNTSVDMAVVADLARLPFPDGSFDLVRARFVLEHLAHPRSTFRELRRVMEPGGHFVFVTTNRFHYVALAATLTPHRFHAWFNQKRGREHEDSFPTAYRANDRKRLLALAHEAGFRVVAIELIEPKPDYLFFHPLVYRAGIAYERVVNRSLRLSGLRCVIVGDLQAA